MRRDTMPQHTFALSPSAIAPKVHWIRREKVILDFDLAALYGVEARALNQAVKRNLPCRVGVERRRIARHLVHRSSATRNEVGSLGGGGNLFCGLKTLAFRI